MKVWKHRKLYIHDEHLGDNKGERSWKKMEEWWCKWSEHLLIIVFKALIGSVYVFSWSQTLAPPMRCWACSSTAVGWGWAPPWAEWRHSPKASARRWAHISASLRSVLIITCNVDVSRLQKESNDNLFVLWILQSKGYAIGNAPELARAHNSHAR